MKKIQYKLSCNITKEEEAEKLHIEMRNSLFPRECYFGHFTFQDLSQALKTIFNNVSDLYIYISKQGCVYFDQQQSSLKICLPIANNIKQFPLLLNVKSKEEGFIFKMEHYQKQKAKLSDNHCYLVEAKNRQIEEVDKKIQEQEHLLSELIMKIQILEKKVRIREKEVNDLQEECDLKMEIVRKNKTMMVSTYNEASVSNFNEESMLNNENNFSHPEKSVKSYNVDSNSGEFSMAQERIQLRKEERQSILQGNSVREKQYSLAKENLGQESYNFTLKQANDLEQKKKFWVKEVQDLRKPKTMPLKRLIHPDARFEEQKVITINGIELKKMSFVEIFINLQILDLSVNQIRNIEGLGFLRNLTKINLSENNIEEIKGFEANSRLLEINLAKNKIRVLQNIFHLEKLQILNLYKNKVQEIPEKIYKLRSLEIIHIDHNCLLRVSENVQFLKRLKEFTIVGNKCYSVNRSKAIIDKLISKGIRTIRSSVIYLQLLSQMFVRLFQIFPVQIF